MTGGRMTHTYALMEVSEVCFNEISEKLLAAGYYHAINVQKDNAVHLDLDGIGLLTEDKNEQIRQGVG